MTLPPFCTMWIARRRWRRFRGSSPGPPWFRAMAEPQLYTIFRRGIDPRRSAPGMMTLTQDRADRAGREDGEKAGDARPGCEHGQCACVELGNLLDRHVRLAGQGCNGALVRSAVVGRRRRGTHSHGDAFVRFERSCCVSKACKGRSITVELVHSWIPSALCQAVGANRVLSAPHAPPMPLCPAISRHTQDRHQS
jgi:hypothetical protein